MTTRLQPKSTIDYSRITRRYDTK